MIFPLILKQNECSFIIFKETLTFLKINNFYYFYRFFECIFKISKKL